MTATGGPPKLHIPLERITAEPTQPSGTRLKLVIRMYASALVVGLHDSPRTLSTCDYR